MLELCQEHDDQERWSYKHIFKIQPDYGKWKPKKHAKTSFKQDFKGGLG
jgi:hypothetical protein